jgi:hypothetical protein
VGASGAWEGGGFGLKGWIMCCWGLELNDLKNLEGIEEDEDGRTLKGGWTGVWLRNILDLCS